MVEYATPVWSPYTVQSITQVEDVQRAFTRRLPGLSGLSYAERLNILGLQTLEHRRLLADLLMCYKIIHGHIALNFDDFFSFFSNPTVVTPVAYRGAEGAIRPGRHSEGGGKKGKKKKRKKRKKGNREKRKKREKENKGEGCNFRKTKMEHLSCGAPMHV